MITEAWILKAKSLGKLNDEDPPEVILSCWQIFGPDLGQALDQLGLSTSLLPKQLFLLKGGELKNEV